MSMEKNRLHPTGSGKNLRMSFQRQKEVLEMPNLIEVQKNSYQWFLDEGLKEVFDDISPIEDYSHKLSLVFTGFKLYKDKANGTPISVPVIASADAPAGTNDLRVSTGTDVDYMYVLANGSTGVGFYPWGGTNLSAGKVYLQAKASYGARAFLGFNDDVTAIEAVKAQNVVKGEYFNLAGQRVAQPTKGLYIVNGRKVVMK